MTQGTVRTSTAPAAAATSWQMWVPCLGMALCSWLSFVDRQVLTILSPTIIKDTGLTAARLHQRDVVLLPHLHARQSGLGLGARLGWPASRHAAGRRHLDGGEHVARGDDDASPGSHSPAPSSASERARTFPGGLRTAVETLPANLRARGIALSFSGGTIGAVMMPLLLGPLAIKYGWRTAFMATGALGLAWMVIWAAIARPPFLPKSPPKPPKMTWPNLRERRVWALIFSYALPAISPGPVLTILAIYLTQRLQLTQAGHQPAGVDSATDVGHRLLLLGLGGRSLRGEQSTAGRHVRPADAGVADAWFHDDGRPRCRSRSALISLSTFIGGGFQMVALKVGSYAFPREQSAMMSGIASGSWSLVNFVLLQAIGPRPT